MAIVELMQGDIVYTAYMTGITAVVAGNILVGGYSGNTDCVSSSGKSSLADSDIWVQNATASLENYTMGIALESANTAVCIPVSARGMYIMRASVISTAGIRIGFGPTADPLEVGYTQTTSWTIGRALTSASAADAYFVVLLDFA